MLVFLVNLALLLACYRVIDPKLKLRTDVKNAKGVTNETMSYEVRNLTLLLPNTL